MSETKKFDIIDGDPIPARVSFPRGPRGSVYPLEELKEGQSFKIHVADEKEAGQKRSYLSALGKSRGIKAITRYLKTEGVVQCWNGGPRDPEEDARNEVRAKAAAAKRAAKKAAQAPGAVTNVPLNDDQTGAADAEAAEHDAEEA
jgi:hypothetical protein